jgi:hypothetical protein
LAGEEILVGLILGIVLVVFTSPVKGVIFIIREQRQQIEFLRDGASERGGEYDKETSEPRSGPLGAKEKET